MGANSRHVRGEHKVVRRPLQNPAKDDTQGFIIDFDVAALALDLLCLSHRGDRRESRHRVTLHGVATVQQGVTQSKRRELQSQEREAPGLTRHVTQNGKPPESGIDPRTPDI